MADYADVILENEKEDLDNLEYSGNENIPVFATVRVTKKDFSVFELLANDFIQNGYVDSNYLTEVFRRESIFTFAFQPSIVLVYSTVPSTHSCLSVATYEHRIRWNTYKIRTVIMAAIRPEDKTLIFKLINELYSDRINPNDTRFIKTKTEFIDFYDNAEVYER